MKPIFLLSAVFVLVSAGVAQKPTNVVLVTIDGFRPDFYLDSSWHTPRLRALLAGGFHADGVNSVFPSMTYPSHTTIMTGVQPVQHGVYYNGMYDATHTRERNYWQDSAVHVPTLAHVLHDKGFKTASLFWPVSAGAPVDYNIPDIGNNEDGALSASSYPKGFFEEVKKNVFANAGFEIGSDENIARIAAYIIKKDMPSFLSVHLFSVDHYEHMQGRTGDSVKAAIHHADAAIGIIEDALIAKGVRPTTVLIVTGDHGFVDVHRVVSPNVWLREAGLIGDFASGNWKAQFYASGGSAYLYLKDPTDKMTEDKVIAILDQQPDSVKKYFRIIDRRKMDDVGGNPEVAFALSGTNGGAFSSSDSGTAIKPGRGGTHGYYPDFREIRTGFIANGPGISKGASVPLMNLRDIAPVIASILHIDFPTAKGKVPAGIFNK